MNHLHKIFNRAYITLFEAPVGYDDDITVATDTKWAAPPAKDASIEEVHKYVRNMLEQGIFEETDSQYGSDRLVLMNDKNTVFKYSQNTKNNKQIYQEGVAWDTYHNKYGKVMAKVYDYGKHWLIMERAIADYQKLKDFFHSKYNSQHNIRLDDFMDKLSTGQLREVFKAYPDIINHLGHLIENYAKICDDIGLYVDEIDEFEHTEILKLLREHGELRLLIEFQITSGQLWDFIPQNVGIIDGTIVSIDYGQDRMRVRSA